MHSSFLLTLLPLVAATKFRVDVGNGALKFVPDNVKASVGDTLEFHYFPMRHSVTESSFDAPCVPVEGGINSGFVPVASGESPTTFTVTVNDTKPIWIYCAQTNGNHCQSGMNMVVNEPSGPNTLEAYRLLAANAGPSQIGAVISGGVLANNTNANVTTGSHYPTASATSSGIATQSSGAASALQAAEWAAIGGAFLFGGLLL